MQSCVCGHAKTMHNLEEKYCDSCYEYDMARPSHKFKAYKGGPVICTQCDKVKSGGDFYGWPERPNKICKACFNRASKREYSIEAIQRFSKDVYLTDEGTYKISRKQDDMNGNE